MTTRRGRGDAGAVIAEVTLILPLLLAFIMGVIDFTYIELKSDEVSSAARDGARVAILNHDVITVGPQTTCDPAQPDPNFTAICHAVARRLAGAKVDSVEVICYAGTGPGAALPSGVTDPHTQASCTSNQIQPDSSTIAVTVTSTLNPLTFVGQTTFGHRRLTDTSQMVVAG